MTNANTQTMLELADRLLTLSDVESSFGREYNAKIMREANDVLRSTSPAQAQDTKSAPVFKASHNSDEGLPNSDAAGAGADTAAAQAPGSARETIIEECAMVCDKHAQWAEDKIEDDSTRSQVFASTSNAANDCAALIRELSGQNAPRQHVDPHMTCERIDAAFSVWRKTLTVVDQPSNQEIFGQGFVNGWNAKEASAQKATTSHGFNESSRAWQEATMNVQKSIRLQNVTDLVGDLADAVEALGKMVREAALASLPAQPPQGTK